MWEYFAILPSWHILAPWKQERAYEGSLCHMRIFCINNFFLKEKNLGEVEIKKTKVEERIFHTRKREGSLWNIVKLHGRLMQFSYILYDESDKPNHWVDLFFLCIQSTLWSFFYYYFLAYPNLRHSIVLRLHLGDNQRQTIINKRVWSRRQYNATKMVANYSLWRPN